MSNAEDVEDDDDDTLDELVEKLTPIQTAIGDLIDSLSPVHDAMARFEKGGKARAAEIERIRDRLVGIEGKLENALPYGWEFDAEKRWVRRAFWQAMADALAERTRKFAATDEGEK